MSIKLKEYILEVLYKTREDKLNKQYNQIFEEQSILVNDKNIIIIYNNKQYFPLNITPKTERILVSLDSSLEESFNTVITNKDKLESNREVLKEYLKRCKKPIYNFIKSDIDALETIRKTISTEIFEKEQEDGTGHIEMMPFETKSGLTEIIHFEVREE